jgi:hypothetical protein
VKQLCFQEFLMVKIIFEFQVFIWLPVNNNNNQYSPINTPSPSKMFFGNSPAGLNNSNDLSLYDEISSDGFGNQDKNDELACKTHYKYFEVTLPINTK